MAGLQARGSPAPARILESSDVFITFLCLYLLSAGRIAPQADAIPMWFAARELVHHGSFAIPRPWPINTPAGVGGHYYPVCALLACLIHVPGALLQTGLEALSPGRATALVTITSRIGPVTVGAAVPTMFFRLLVRHGYGRRAAAAATLLLGAATSVWVYARLPYSEITQTACFLAFFAALVEAERSPTRGSFFRLGLTVGLLVNSKTIYVVCFPGALAFLIWRLRGRATLRDALPVLWGILPGALAFALYNWMRWGSVFTTGYESVTHGFWRESVLVGLWGQLLSPGKSLFLYSPPVLLSFFGLRAFWQRQRQMAVAVAVTVIPVLLVYSHYAFWSGDWGWGPRYLVFALPVLLLPSVELFTAAPEGAKRRRRALLVGSVFAAGVTVQLLGSAFCWDDFTIIARTAQRQWLGMPDLRETVMAPDPCFSCFEQMYGIDWLPPFQPIAGNWWLLRHKLAHDDWRRAEADAPWRRVTSIGLDISPGYDGAHIDWWPMIMANGVWPAALMCGALLLVGVPWRAWKAALEGPADQPAPAVTTTPDT